MDLKKVSKKQYLVLVVIGLLALALTSLLIRQLGVKDGAMFFIGTFLLGTAIYLLKDDIKSSILLFIISFPILVTARKVCYFDFFIIKITYESIYITILFVIKFKDIVKILRRFLDNRSKSQFHFIMLICLFVIFSYGSSMYSINLYSSISEQYLSIIVPVMFMLSVVASFEKQDIKKVYYALIIGVDLSCIYGFLQLFIYNIPLNNIKSNRAFLTFGYHNVNIFANIIMMIIPFLLQLMLYEKNTKKENIFLSASFLVNVLAIFITYTRGAWLSFLLTLFLIILSKKYRKLIYIFVLGFAVVAKPVLSYILKRGTNTSILTNESAIARVQSIFTSIRIMVDYPFGTGANTFAEMYKKYMESGYLLMPESMRSNMNVANYALENAHNLWLQIGVELGLVCLIVFLLIVINRMVASIKNYKINRPAFISLVMFLVFSVLTGFEFNHKGVITNNLILWLVFAIIQINTGYGDWENNSKESLQ